MPERTPLNARTVGSFEREGYRVEKVVYESQPNFHISANLYIPTTGHPPYPGVLFQMGHTTNGKAGDLYQRCCQGLARLGYLVLGFDPMGQGERTYYPGASAFPQPARRRRGAHPSRPADAAEGRYRARACRPGMPSAAWITWPRIRWWIRSGWPPPANPAAAPTPCCWPRSTTGWPRRRSPAASPRTSPAPISIRPGSTDDAEQNFIGSGPAGFDRWDLLYPLAPKPLLILASDRDFFGTYSPNYISSGTEEFAEAAAGLRDRWDTPTAWPGSARRCPHGLAYDMRMQIYNWFGRWLKGETKPIDAGTAHRARNGSRRSSCRASGNVVQSLHSETPFSLNRKRVVAKHRRAARPPAAAWTVRRGLLRTTLFAGVLRANRESRPWSSPPRPKSGCRRGCSSRDREKRRRLDHRARTGAAVRPGTKENSTTDWREQGYTVCAPDLRGIGDSTPEFGRARRPSCPPAQQR